MPVRGVRRGFGLLGPLAMAKDGKGVSPPNSQMPWKWAIPEPVRNSDTPIQNRQHKGWRSPGQSASIPPNQFLVIIDAGEWLPPALPEVGNLEGPMDEILKTAPY